MSVLEIKNLHVSVEDKEILKGLNLTLKTGEIAAIMGPNGTGKSTLSAAIMGNPNYEITEGDILFDGESILDLEVDERARLGLFLAMQYPAEIPGITNAEFIRAAMNAGKEDDEKISVLDFITKLDEKMELLVCVKKWLSVTLMKVSQVVRKNVTKSFNCSCWNLSLLFSMRLTQVLILMPLKWFQKGLTLCVAKASVL